MSTFLSHPALYFLQRSLLALLLLGLAFSLTPAIHAALANTESDGRPQSIAPGQTPDGLNADEWQSIQTQIAAGPYRAVATEEGGFVSANPAQGWQIAAAATTTLTHPVADGLNASDWAQIQSQLAPEEITTYSQQAKLTASDAAADDLFGRSVAISGDTAVIGAPENDDAGIRSGSAYVFIRSGGGWSQQAKLTASDATSGDEFGVSVAVDGDTAVIGSVGDDDGGSFSGSAYVFTRSGGVWSQQDKLTASDANSFDYFGISVAVSGDTAVIGASGGDSERGLAYVFTRSGGAWSQQAKLTASDATVHDYFGGSVAVSGNTAVIGVYGDNNYTGSAYVFTRSGEVWTQQAKLTASDAAAFDFFGISVAVSGDTAVIGAYQNSDAGEFSGSAYVFTRSGEVWTEQAKLTASDAATHDRFGASVAVSGDTAIIGAYRDDDGGLDSGSAYVFTRSDGVWTQQAKLTASDAAADDRFGNSVAVSGNTTVIGAAWDDGGGINSGSAYVFAHGYPLTITLFGAGSGNIVSNPSGIDCGLNCEAFFLEGMAITLTATAETGSTFTGWSGDIVTITNPITLTMDSAQTITATFALNEYELTTATAGNGAGNVSPTGGIYAYGTVITLTATAEMGSTFTGWSGDISSTVNPVTLTIDGNKTITATFALSHPLTVAPSGTGSGNIVSNPVGIDCGLDCERDFLVNTVVTLTATAGTESTFTGWSGDVSSTANPITVTIDGAKAITATFTLNEYELTTSIAGNGAGTVSPAGGTYPYGTVITLTAMADTGSTFAGWSGDVNSTVNPITVTMDSAQIITATFALNEYTIALSVEPVEGGMVVGGGLVTHGQVVTVTATSGTGYTFVNWTEDEEVVSIEANYSFIATTGRHLVAHFAAIPPSSFKIYLPFMRR